MTYEQWGKEIEEAPKIYDGSSKHVHARMYADWTADREVLQTEVNRQREGWTDTYEILDDAARDAAYQRRHRKWLVKSARILLADYRSLDAYWQGELDVLEAKLKEYEAFNEPLRRTYNENTAEEVTP